MWMPSDLNSHLERKNFLLLVSEGGKDVKIKFLFEKYFPNSLGFFICFVFNLVMVSNVNKLKLSDILLHFQAAHSSTSKYDK